MLGMRQKASGHGALRWKTVCKGERMKGNHNPALLAAMLSTTSPSSTTPRFFNGVSTLGNNVNRRW